MKQLLTKICPTCNKLFSRSRPSVMQRQTYCSRSCAIIPRNKNGLARKAGLASVAKQAITRRSKNEIEFANLCALQFNILTNVQMFEGWDADIIKDMGKFNKKFVNAEFQKLVQELTGKKTKRKSAGQSLQGRQ